MLLRILLLMFFFVMSTGQTAEPFFTPNSSNDAIGPRKVPFEISLLKIFVFGDFPSQKPLFSGLL
jgi:hypothetical protein